MKKSKYLVGVFLFIFWVLATALVTAGLLSRQQTKQATCALPVNSALDNNTATTALTVEEVAKHSTANDCWMIVNGKVYNVTGLVTSHSGGSQQILNDCGRDGSLGFNTKYQGRAHSGGAQAMMVDFYLGDLGATVNAMQATQKINSNPPSRRFRGEDD